MYFLDSCICIDFMRGRLPYAYGVFQASDPRLFKVPSVVQAELLLGARKSANPKENHNLVEQFLLPFEVVSFDARCAYEYAEIRAQLEEEGRLIGPNDLLIAATARAHKGTLVTNNVKEFQRVEGLELESWYDVELKASSGE